MMQLSQVCDAVGGVMFGDDCLFHNVSINTRDDCAGRLFVALKGDNFDAHDYVTQAAAAGAAALMVERAVDSDLPTIQVASTHRSLLDLAAWWRAQFSIPVVSITGSAGKTTVKEMTASIFSAFGEGVATIGNLNNQIGVPLTLMRLKADDRYAIVEMGMNHPGEIAVLSCVARPTVALITNAGAAHLEGLGTVAAVATAKGEIFEGLADDGVAVINADDAYAEQWRVTAQGRHVVTFGLTNSADISATYTVAEGGLVLDVTTPNEAFSVRLETVGEHNVRNALAAISLAWVSNIPIDLIQRGLAAYRAPNGRLAIRRFGGRTVIDDTYNANPVSMAAAIKVLRDFKQTTLIVGDMAELGATAVQAHHDLGALAAEAQIDCLLACGEFAPHIVEGFGSAGLAFDSQSALLTHLQTTLPVGAVLVKGSRSARMERVVSELEMLFKNNSMPLAGKAPGNNAC
ncbi:UDP-N-acetylmuramoyl-tripeptide--D-alanyl-D-alanine ligase [Arenicella chitinivorans]|uniref:UDP-N-acetylmuramoyl-tripeptide--D-alanyl-D-alanine ligase n=1 Tax=Arenicella chitinivorans TaxID=1329800 RepID=A0A918VJ63_9GAMM|nr:UDP-N-acetylmuramoyl-tripeptide--D-alanyl-D-alanine ligase [Arenicella chitinivorans]GHA05843.1 UDP-N-acetylmuramoyl-tripeptide--D-alanyl-D-alanine ligase [Arenicella chitinivorans]